jgi:hypothetical protein
MDAHSELDWLTEWYSSQCDGEWEHRYGVRIDTIDNPGWSLKIDLKGTSLEGRHLEKAEHSYEHDEEWWLCWTECAEFNAAGGPRQLGNMIRGFRDWPSKLLNRPHEGA